MKKALDDAHSFLPGSIPAIWSRILKTGYARSGPGLLRARLMLLNGLVTVVLLSVIAFSIAYAVAGYRYYYGPLYIVPVGMGVFWLNAKGHFKWAQNVYFFGALLVVSYWCYEGRGNGNEFILIGLAITATLIFEKRNAVIFSNVLCAAIFILYKIYHAATPFTPDPAINYDVTSTIILLNTVGVISFQITFFRELAKHYDRKLKDRYNELKSAQEDLKSNNEEMGAMNEKLHAITSQLENMVNEKTMELQTYINAIDVNLYSCINDLQGNFIKVNDRLVAASGYTRDELIGKHYNLLATPEHQQQHAEERRTQLFAGKAWRGEVEHRNKQGMPYWFDCVVIPLTDTSGTIRLFLSIGLPITERKLNDMLRDKTHRVLESIAFKASHKIRGPMARIKGLANLVASDVVQDDELKSISRRFSDCSDELSAAVSELVDFVNDHQELLLTQEPTRSNA